jgi:hypothetical protein
MEKSGTKNKIHKWEFKHNQKKLQTWAQNIEFRGIFVFIENFFDKDKPSPLDPCKLYE